MTVGEKIRKYRVAQGLLQKDLAKKCKMSESAIRNYELGNRTPKPHNLEIIAKALDISPFALMNPNLDSEVGLMHSFFYLEDNYALQVKKNGGVAYICFDVNTAAGRGMQDRLQEWEDMKESLAKEDYEKWKDIYPAKLKK